MMKLKFNPNLDYQDEAVKAVVDLFDGQNSVMSYFSFSGQQSLDSGHGVGNKLELTPDEILENLKKDVGIVDVIVGISQLQVVIQGKAGHAGTTPMGMRGDALLSASRVIAAAEKIAIEAGEYCVATVGRLNVYPNGSNVIPDKVT